MFHVDQLFIKWINIVIIKINPTRFVQKGKVIMISSSEYQYISFDLRSIPQIERISIDCFDSRNFSHVIRECPWYSKKIIQTFIFLQLKNICKVIVIMHTFSYCDSNKFERQMDLDQLQGLHQNYLLPI